MRGPRFQPSPSIPDDVRGFRSTAGGWGDLEMDQIWKNKVLDDAQKVWGGEGGESPGHRECEIEPGIYRTW